MKAGSFLTSLCLSLPSSLPPSSPGRAGCLKGMCLRGAEPLLLGTCRLPHPLCVYFFCSHHPPPHSALLCTPQQLSIIRVKPLTFPDAPVVTSLF